MGHYPKGLYGGRAPRVEGSDTSEAAGDAMTPRANTIRESVYDLVRQAGSLGVTCDEMEAILQKPHTTVSARVRELSLLGRIADTGNRRKTRWGRSARVYGVIVGTCEKCDRPVFPDEEYDFADDPTAADGALLICEECKS